MLISGTFTSLLNKGKEIFYSVKSYLLNYMSEEVLSLIAIALLVIIVLFIFLYFSGGKTGGK